jgi:hypothetical protein
VNTSYTHCSTGSHHLYLTAAIALFLGSGWSGVTQASSVSSTSFDAEEHPRYCHCGPKCRQGSCCCGPHKSKAGPSPFLPLVALLESGSSPCMTSAPCRDAELPDPPRSVESPGKMTAAALDEVTLPTGPETLLPVPPRCILPARRVLRLDKPPERLPSA